jgi:act minimal PKS acyl carrier protein
MDITVEEIRRILIADAGAPDTEVADGDFADTTFEDLGYESLALLEAAATIEREYRVLVPEETVFAARTPRELSVLLRSAEGVAQA